MILQILKYNHKKISHQDKHQMLQEKYSNLMIHLQKHPHNKIHLLDCLNYKEKLNNYKNINKFVIQINLKNNKINSTLKKFKLIQKLKNLKHN